MVIIIIDVDLFGVHHHIISPILSCPRVHIGNALGAEAMTALVPALKLLTGLQTLILYSTLSVNSCLTHKWPGVWVVVMGIVWRCACGWVYALVGVVLILLVIIIIDVDLFGVHHHIISAITHPSPRAHRQRAGGGGYDSARACAQVADRIADTRCRRYVVRQLVSHAQAPVSVCGGYRYCLEMSMRLGVYCVGWCGVNIVGHHHH